MSQQQSKLTFFCEMCNKAIDSNICEVHGIDFVTIKKISLNGSAGSLSRSQRKGVTHPPESPVLTESSPETGLVPLKAKRPPRSREIPALPGGPGTPPLENLNAAPPAEPGLPQSKLLPPGGNSDSDVGIPSFQRQRVPLQQAPVEAREEFVYQEEEVEDYYEPNAAPQVVVQAGGSSNMWILASIAVLVVCVLTMGLFVYNGFRGSNPTALYSRAEALYGQNDLNGALSLYREFAETYPENPLASIVLGKIDKIRKEVRSGTGEIDEEIKQLMLAASTAFEQDNYIAPRNENALALAQQVLDINPNYGPALDLKSKIIHYCENEANVALRDKDYNTALSYYQTMSEIMPKNTTILNKIREILTEKSKASDR